MKIDFAGSFTVVSDNYFRIEGGQRELYLIPGLSHRLDLDIEYIQRKYIECVAHRFEHHELVMLIRRFSWNDSMLVEVTSKEWRTYSKFPEFGEPDGPHLVVEFRVRAYGDWWLFMAMLAQYDYACSTLIPRQTPKTAEGGEK